MSKRVKMIIRDLTQHDIHRVPKEHLHLHLHVFLYNVFPFNEKKKK